MLSEPRLRSKLEQPRWPWLGDAVNRERTSLLVPLLRCVLIAFALPVMRRSEIQSASGRGEGRSPCILCNNRFHDANVSSHVPTHAEGRQRRWERLY